MPRHLDSRQRRLCLIFPLHGHKGPGLYIDLLNAINEISLCFEIADRGLGIMEKCNCVLKLFRRATEQPLSQASHVLQHFARYQTSLQILADTWSSTSSSATVSTALQSNLRIDQQQHSIRFRIAPKQFRTTFRVTLSHCSESPRRFIRSVSISTQLQSIHRPSSRPCVSLLRSIYDASIAAQALHAKDLRPAYKPSPTNNDAPRYKFRREDIHFFSVVAPANRVAGGTAGVRLIRILGRGGE